MLDAQQLVARVGADVRRKIVLQPASDHHLDEGGAIDLGDWFRGHVPAVAEHGHVIAQPEDLFETMADVDARDVAVAQPDDQLVEPIGFVLREAARRLVEDDDPRAVCDRARDLQHLLLADRELADRTVDVDRWSDRGQHLRRTAPHLAQRDETGGVRERSEAEVFGDGQVLAERELLMHHAHAGRERVGG